MSYWQLVRSQPRLLFFGFLTAFFSGLGQTHFVALFSPTIMNEFNLSHADYGSIYSFVTLLSGFCMSFVGPTIDRYDARWIGLWIALALVISQSLLLTHQLWTVALGLFGLRLLGQGMLSNLSSIVITRFFNQNRGKALSLSSMGFPIYEGLMTPLFAFLLTAYALWGVSLILLALVTFVFLPTVFLITRDQEAFNKPHLEKTVTSSTHTPSTDIHWTRSRVFKNPTLYMILPQVLMSPFALTGLFFHQAAIAQIKGWELTTMASGLSFFAIGRILNSFLTGPLVDRYTAMGLFPFYQIPMIFGFLVLGLWDHSLAIGVSYFLFGLTVGSGGTIKSAVWAELYGLHHLGSIKSSIATIMVFSTAISPALFGFFLDQNAAIQNLLFALALIASISALITLSCFKRWPSTSSTASL